MYIYIPDLSLGDQWIDAPCIPPTTQLVVGPFPFALGPCWALPTERSEACSKRSDDVRGCQNARNTI